MYFEFMNIYEKLPLANSIVKTPFEKIFSPLSIVFYNWTVRHVGVIHDTEKLFEYIIFENIYYYFSFWSLSLCGFTIWNYCSFHTFTKIWFKRIILIAQTQPLFWGAKTFKLECYTHVSLNLWMGDLRIE